MNATPVSHIHDHFHDHLSFQSVKRDDINPKTEIKSVALILPIFNYANEIPETLLECSAVLETLSSLETFHIILVNDGSTDDTSIVAESTWNSMPYHPSKRFLHIVNLKSRSSFHKSIKIGLHAALTVNADAVVVLDENGLSDPTAIPKMLRALKTNDIVFSKYYSSSRDHIWNVLNKTVEFFNWVFYRKKLSVGTFCAFAPNVLSFLLDFIDLEHLSAKFSTTSFKQTEVVVSERKSHHKISHKQRYQTLFNHLLATFTLSSETWIRFFAKVGLWIFGISFAGIVGGTIYALSHTSHWTSGFLSAYIIATLLTLCVSFQALGFLILTSFLKRLLKYHVPSEVNLVTSTSVIEASGSEQHYHLRAVS